MPNKFQCEFISLDKIYSLCYQLAENIKSANYQPDIIVGIARGGIIPARLVCDFLHVHQLTSLKIEHYTSTDKNEEAILKYEINADVEGKNVLLVDDINDTGKSIKVALDHIKKQLPKSIKVAVMHEKTDSMLSTDFFVEPLTSWRWLIYQWTLVEDVSGFIEKSNCTSVVACCKMLLDDYGVSFTAEEIINLQPFLKRKLNA